MGNSSMCSRPWSFRNAWSAPQPRAISRRFQSASRPMYHLSDIPSILAPVGIWWLLHTRTHKHTHTQTHTQIFHCGSSPVSLSVSKTPFFPVMKPSLSGDDLFPTLWPSFPISSSSVELCISSWCRWGPQGPQSNPQGSVPEGAWPWLGMVALALLPSTRFPHCPESFLTGSVFPNTLYLFLSDSIRNRYCLLLLPSSS